MQATGTRGGEEAFESVDGKFVYYAKLQELGIWRAAAEGGEETRVIDQGGLGLWALTGQGICFFDMSSSAGSAIRFYDLLTRRVKVIHLFSKQTRMDNTTNTAITVSPDGRWILYTQLDQAGTNLMLVENFR